MANIQLDIWNGNAMNTLRGRYGYIHQSFFENVDNIKCFVNDNNRFKFKKKQEQVKASK
jgi:hypothetical protein